MVSVESTLVAQAHHFLDEYLLLLVVQARVERLGGIGDVALICGAVDQRNVADAAEPLYSSLDDKQKQTFIEEMVRLSHERGLD